jgi:ribosomal protein S2
MKLKKKLLNSIKNKNDLSIYLKKAITTIFNYHKYKKTILFVGNFSNENKIFINKKFKTSHIFLSNSDWIYGMLTNKNSFIKNLIKKNDRKLKDYNLQKFITKTKKPDLIVILNLTQNSDLIKESLKLKIPIISFVKDNFDNFILYPIKVDEKIKIRNFNFIFYLLNSLLKRK